MFDLDGSRLITQTFRTGSISLKNDAVLEASEALNLLDGAEVTVQQSVIRVKSFLGVDLTSETQEAQAMKTVLAELGATILLTDSLLHILGNYSFTKEALLDEYQTELLAVKGYQSTFAP